MEQEIRCETANWNNLTQDSGQKGAVVNAVMNFRFPKIRGTFFWLAEELQASQDELC
jgi:hypothetical protein